MLGYIYKVTNLIDGRIYIGQHKSEVFDESYKGSGTYIKRAISKHGWDNFKVEMLCPCFSIEELNEEEIFAIDYFNARDKSIGYNLTAGGLGHLNYSPTEETRIKLSKRSKGNQNFLGHTHSDEWRHNMSVILSGREFSDETRNKMSKSAKSRGAPIKAIEASAIARRGKSLSDEVKSKISLANTGKVRSEETRKKISESKIGSTFSLSEEARKKISESNSKREITDSMRINMSKGSSKYVYNYEGTDYYGWKSIVNYLRNHGYPKFSQTSLNKLVVGLPVKGYENLSGLISRELVGDRL